MRCSCSSLSSACKPGGAGVPLCTKPVLHYPHADYPVCTTGMQTPRLALHQPQLTVCELHETAQAEDAAGLVIAKLHQEGCDAQGALISSVPQYFCTSCMSWSLILSQGYSPIMYRQQIKCTITSRTIKSAQFARSTHSPVCSPASVNYIPVNSNLTQSLPRCSS